MEERDGKRRVAIACQGGGSHAAFTAGVLKKLFSREVLDERGYEVVALSGTSGGAICAFLAWYALLKNENERATELLDSFWREDNSAHSLDERLLNGFLLWNNSVTEATFGVPVSSPYYYPFYSYSPDYWQDRLGASLRKRIGEGIEERVDSSGSDLMLFVGAVNVLNGEFQLFRSHKPGDGGFVFNDSEEDAVGVEAVLASAALPFTFKAVHTGKAVYRDGQVARVGEGVYWDGLSAHNPPIRDLTEASPDEVWIVQINPEEIDEEPRTTAKIWDRRNELAGNLSLNQEIHSVRKTNELVRRLGEWEDGVRVLRVPGTYEKQYKVIKVRRIELTIPLYASSKLNRNPSFIRKLMDHGEKRAGEFLEATLFQTAFEAAWERAARERDEESVDAVIDLLAEDAILEFVPPAGSPAARQRVDGPEEIRSLVERGLEKGFTLEQSRDYHVSPDGNTLSFWLLATAEHLRDPVRVGAELVVREGRLQACTFHLLSLEAVERLQETVRSSDQGTASS